MDSYSHAIPCFVFSLFQPCLYQNLAAESALPSDWTEARTPTCQRKRWAAWDTWWEQSGWRGRRAARSGSHRSIYENILKYWNYGMEWLKLKDVEQAARSGVSLFCFIQVLFQVDFLNWKLYFAGDVKQFEGMPISANSSKSVPWTTTIISK